MRWQGLFADLEAQFEQAAAAELAGEVSERTRREAALLRMVDRLRPGAGHPLVVTVAGHGVLRGRLVDTGCDWLLLEEPGGRELLVPLAAVLGVSGLGVRTAGPGTEGPWRNGSTCAGPSAVWPVAGPGWQSGWSTARW